MWHDYKPAESSLPGCKQLSQQMHNTDGVCSGESRLIPVMKDLQLPV